MVTNSARGMVASGKSQADKEEGEVVMLSRPVGEDIRAHTKLLRRTLE